MKLIFIGRDFYYKSGTMMSSIYTETGERSDWGMVEAALENGEKVNIRPATKAEVASYKRKLAPYVRARKS